MSLGKWYTSWKAARSRALRSPMPDGTWFEGELYPKGKEYDSARCALMLDRFFLSKPYPKIPTKPEPDWTGTLFESTENQ